MKKQDQFTIIENISLPDRDFILNVRPQHHTLNGVHPGQFVNILIPDSSDTFLRRPISVCDVDIETNVLTLYIKKVGKGTHHLSTRKAGDSLDILFPLGNGFAFEGVKHPLLLGGGAGIAPMVYLSKEIRKTGVCPQVLLAGKTAEALDIRRLFEEAPALCTDDGSLGEKGLITQHPLMRDLSAFDRIFCCGPTPMMKAVARLAENAGVPCMVSMENTMACGLGACLCCITPTEHHGNQCVCTDGPVFDSRELKSFH